MNHIENTLCRIFVKSILVLSLLCFAIWTVEYSGLVWSPDKFLASVKACIIGLAKNWGPIFGPTAAILFVITLLKKNLQYEITNQLSAQIKSDLSGLMHGHLNSVAHRSTAKGINAVYHGIKEHKAFSKLDVERMRSTSLENFDSAHRSPMPCSTIL